jgi:hypothetical protein
MVDAFKSIGSDVALGEVGYWITARFKEEEDVLAIGDPRFTEAHAHSPTQWLGVQKSLGQ